MSRLVSTVVRCLQVWLVAMAVMAPLAQAGGSIRWADDYEQAVKVAAEKDRRIFILFTNSKTCAPCRMLKTNVIAQSEFIDYAESRLVMLEVDYAPYFNETDKMTLDEIEKNRKIPREMAVKGRGPWPYLFILSASGKVLYSGEAYGPERDTARKFLDFLNRLNGPMTNVPASGP